MKKKIWSIYGEPNGKSKVSKSLPEGAESKVYDNPDIILNEYANLVFEETDKQFKGIVTEATSEDSNEATYALYIVVPELKNYMYRLIEVSVPNIMQPYPLEITIFAKDPKNNRSFSCENVSSFRKRLEEMITSSLTKVILMHLKNLININKPDYFFLLTDEKPLLKYNLKAPYLPITIKKIVLKSHLGKPIPEWTQVLANSFLKITSLNVSTHSKHERIISLLQFISVYQSQPVMELKYTVPEYLYYIDNKSNDCTIEFELQYKDKEIEFNFFYEAEQELKS